MLFPHILKFEDKIIHCGTVVKEALPISTHQTVSAYAFGTGARRSLFVSPEKLSPDLYFLRTIIGNYRGVTADLMELLSSHGVDVRGYEDITIGNIALWNVCVKFPKDVNKFELRRIIMDEMTHKTSMVRPIDFFFFEWFPFCLNIEQEQHMLEIDDDYNLALDDETIGELNVTWDVRKASPIIATPLDHIRGILFYFINPRSRIVKCEFLIKDRKGTLSALTRIVAEHVDLVASRGDTIRFGESAKWRFYGILVGVLDTFKKKLEKCEPEILDSFSITEVDITRL